MTPIDLTRPDNHVRRIDEQVHCAIEGNVVVMTLADGAYFELNPVGARIWDEIAEPVRVSDLVNRLVDDYDVDAETCRSEVTEWLTRMHELGLVQTAPA